MTARTIQEVQQKDGPKVELVGRAVPAHLDFLVNQIQALGQIRLRLKGKPLRAYRYRDFGSLVSLGKYSTVGSMMGGLLSRGLGRGVGFSKLVSVGNECDLGVGEIAECLVDDPHTGAILLFMETIRGAEHLARAARRACAAGKPMIVYKLGRSSVGQDLAASHTGALAGDTDRLLQIAAAVEDQRAGADRLHQTVRSALG